MTRRDFLKVAAGAATIPSAIASPIHSLLAARGISQGDSSSSDYSASDYVQDGLIAMWDGIENSGWGIHDGNASEWVDLIGGNNLINNGNTWSKNCLNYVRVAVDSMYSTTSVRGVRTFEFIIGIDNLSRTNWAFPITLGNSVSDPENRIIQLWGRGVNTIQGKLIGQDGFALPEITNTWPTTLDVQFTYGDDNFANLCIVNGSIREQVNRREQAGGYYDGVNLCYSKNYHNTQRYYVIRAYDRELSLEELAYNREIDKLRFGIEQ